MKRENSIGVVVVPASDHDTHTQTNFCYVFVLLDTEKESQKDKTAK